MLAKINKTLPVLTCVSVLDITLVVVTDVAVSAAAIFSEGLLNFLSAILQNAGGIALGYGEAKLFKQSFASRRTLSIEVGMQNSGLASGPSK